LRLVNDSSGDEMPLGVDEQPDGVSRVLSRKEADSEAAKGLALTWNLKLRSGRA
jgi:hypothetical protein